MSGLVYFIKPVGMDGPIKIGFSTAPETRLAQLSIWSPFPLEIVATVPGRYQDEQYLHSCFADVHSHQEWFHASSLLKETIEKAKRAINLDWIRRDLTPIGTVRPTGKGSRPVPEYKAGFRSYNSRVMHAARKSKGQDRGIFQIMDQWRGGVRPTRAEFDRLDEYLGHSPASRPQRAS